LEVGVHIKAENDSVLKANENDLSDIYIVSQATLTNEKPSGEILNEHSEDGYTVWVVKAKGEKCSRCWKYRELNSNGICPDCAEAVGE
jgi:isoleucyl-tRNA synthetase